MTQDVNNKVRTVDNNADGLPITSEVAGGVVTNLPEGTQE